MLKSRISRIVAVATLIALPLVAVQASSAPAGASTLKIKCTGLTGTIGGNEQYTGCTAAATGGSSVPAAEGECQSNCTTTTDWTNGDSTTWSYNTTEGGTLCGKNLEVTIKGTVTADTTGYAPVGGKVSGIICANTKTGTLSMAPGKSFKWK